MQQNEITDYRFSSIYVQQNTDSKLHIRATDYKLSISSVYVQQFHIRATEYRYSYGSIYVQQITNSVSVPYTVPDIVLYTVPYTVPYTCNRIKYR